MYVAELLFRRDRWCVQYVRRLQIKRLSLTGCEVKNMADAAHRITDEKLEEMEKRLSAIYSRAEKEMGEQWK